MPPSQTPLIVSCPSCKKSLRWTTDNPFRPFCSERCKLIDLGEWADGQYHSKNSVIQQYLISIFFSA